MRFALHRAAILSAAAFAVMVAATPVPAQNFPDHKLTLIVPVSPGGPTDILARELAEKLRARFGQPIIVENKPGAATYLGGAAVARAAPDGYTLLINGTGGLYTDLFVAGQEFVLSRDLMGVAPIAEAPLAFVVPASLPVRDLREFIAYARANPKKLNMGVFPRTTAPLQAASFLDQNHADLVEIPYSSSAAAIMGALAAGDIQFYLGVLATAKPFIDSGRIRALAVASEERFFLAPDVSTTREQGFDFQASTLYVVLAPSGTPPQIVKFLNEQIHAVLDAQDSRETWRKLGFVPAFATAEELAARIAAERSELTAEAARAGIKPE
jgi:tripartite-type tricarboxylate transporter receptor subunit TctC